MVSWFLFVSSDSSREICVTDMGTSCIAWEDIQKGKVTMLGNQPRGICYEDKAKLCVRYNDIVYL